MKNFHLYRGLLIKDHLGYSGILSGAQFIDFVDLLSLGVFYLGLKKKKSRTA